MNILYASDDNYAEIAGISIVSLLENNKDIDNIKFFIFDNGLSLQNKNNLSSIVKNYSKEIIFIDIPDIEKLVGIKLDPGFWAISIFARLFAASLLSEDVEKIIYLDCDTLIRSSLLPLWNENLNGNLIGGCEDGIPVLHKKSIFLKKTDVYVNSGVLLIDLKAWRDNEIETKFINFLRLFDGKLRYPDQDVINGVLKNHIKLVAPKYNSISYYFEYNPELLYYANINDYYSQTELNEAKESPVIVHFAGAGRKPWTNGNIHIYQTEYTKYRNMTPWENMPMREPDTPVPAKAKNPVKRLYERLNKVKEIRRLIKYAKTRKKQSSINLDDCYIK